MPGVIDVVRFTNLASLLEEFLNQIEDLTDADLTLVINGQRRKESAKNVRGC